MLPEASWAGTRDKRKGERKAGGVSFERRILSQIFSGQVRQSRTPGSPLLLYLGDDTGTHSSLFRSCSNASEPTARARPLPIVTST